MAIVQSMRFNQIFAGTFIGLGLLILIFGTALVLIIQIYEFLATGAWHWDTVASYLLAMNFNAEDFAEHLVVPKWPGVTDILLWLFFACPFICWTIVVGAVLTVIGTASDQ
jgi:hypothetical protein